MDMQKMTSLNSGLVLLVLLSTAISARATLITSGQTFPSTPSTLENYNGQISVGYGGQAGSLEVNASPSGNGITSAEGSGLLIGRDTGSTGTVTVTGDGSAASAKISIFDGIGIRLTQGGAGSLSITSGGLVEGRESNIYLGGQGLTGTAGSAVTTIDGANSLLMTQQGSVGESWERDGGRIYVGFDGQSHSTVTIANGASMQALNGGVGDGGDDGSIWIGTSADPGSTAIVNVDGAGSTMVANNYIEVGGRSAGVNAELNITNGGSVEVDEGYAGSATDIDVYIAAFPLDSNAAVNLNGHGSSLSADDIQIGGTTAIVGFTGDGVPVISPDWSALAEGEQVTDGNGSLIYDYQGNPVLAEVVYFGEFAVTLPATYVEGNEIYVKNTGAMTVENGAEVNAHIINVSKNDADGLAIGDEPATLVVRDGGIINSDVNVYTDGLLTGDGIIAGPVHIEGGMVSPGNSPGEMTFLSDLFLNSGMLEFEIGQLEQDSISVQGDLTLGSDFIISLIFDFSPMGYLLDLEELFDVSGAFTVENGFNLANNIQLLGLGAGASVTTRFMGSEMTFAGDNMASVPEPSSLLIWALGLGLMGLMSPRKGEGVKSGFRRAVSDLSSG